MGRVGWLVVLDCDLEWQQQGLEPLRCRRRVSSEMDGWMDDGDGPVERFEDGLWFGLDWCGR